MKHFLIELQEGRCVIVNGDRLVVGLNGWLDVFENDIHVAHFSDAKNAFQIDHSQDAEGWVKP